MSEPFSGRRCADCGELYGHPPVVCRVCGSETLEEVDLAAAGRLYASTTIRVPGSDHAGQEPFQVGLVDVGEGETVRVVARLEADERLDPDTPVEYVGRRDGAFLFRPV